MALLGGTVTSKAPDYTTMLGAGVVKFGEERILARTPVGNGTLVSAAVKGVAGYAIHHFAGGKSQFADMFSLGFTVDAVEDALYVVLNTVLGAGVGNGGGNW